MTQTPLPQRQNVETVEEGRIYAYDAASQEYIALEVNGNGELEVAATINEAALGVLDSTGTRIDPATDQTLSSTLSREIAVWSAGTIPVEQQTPVGLENSAGTQVDPATEPTLSAIASALASNATDSVLVDSNTALDASAAEVDVDINSQTLAALSTDLAPALASNATDSVLVDSNTALDASAATIQADVTDQQGRNLGKARLMDSSNTLINPATETDDEAFASGAALSASATLTVGSFAEAGAERIVGQVVSSGSYDVQIDWKDSAGTVIRTETINSGLTGGTWYDVNVQAKSPYADVNIVDTSAASQTVDATLHVR